MREVSPPKTYHLVRMNKNTAGDKTRFGCKMADRLRSASTEIEDSSSWFIEPQVRRRRPLSAPSEVLMVPMEPKYKEPGFQFLTANGEIITSAGVKELGGSTCSVDEKRETHDDCKDLDSISEHWYPLSMTALNDYRGIQSRAVSGYGRFRHGNTKLWKPANTIK